MRLTPHLNSYLTATPGFVKEKMGMPMYSPIGQSLPIRIEKLKQIWKPKPVELDAFVFESIIMEQSLLNTPADVIGLIEFTPKGLVLIFPTGSKPFIKIIAQHFE